MNDSSFIPNLTTKIAQWPLHTSFPLPKRNTIFIWLDTSFWRVTASTDFSGSKSRNCALNGRKDTTTLGKSSPQLRDARRQDNRDPRYTFHRLQFLFHDSCDTVSVATTEMVHVRVDRRIKVRATKALAAMGLSVSDAVRVLLTRAAAGALPFEVKAPNAATAAAMRGSA